jgi:hypothetical protein
VHLLLSVVVRAHKAVRLYVTSLAERIRSVHRGAVADTMTSRLSRQQNIGFRFPPKNSAECGTKGPTEAERWHPGIHYNSRRFTLSKAVRYQQAISPHRPVRYRLQSLFRNQSRDHSFESSLVRLQDLPIVRSARTFPRKRAVDCPEKRWYLVAGKRTDSFST